MEKLQVINIYTEIIDIRMDLPIEPLTLRRTQHERAYL
jgi:hypothetical protein